MASVHCTGQRSSQGTSWRPLAWPSQAWHFPLHKPFQVALHSQVHTIFPPHQSWMINPGENIVSKLAKRSLFPEAGQMTENPLSGGFWAVGGHGFSMGVVEAEEASLQRQINKVDLKKTMRWEGKPESLFLFQPLNRIYSQSKTEGGPLILWHAPEFSFV